VVEIFVDKVVEIFVDIRW